MSNRVQLKKYDFSGVNGISQNQLDQHYTLYAGYVNKINEIWGILEKEKVYPNPNTTFSRMRSLKLGESYALDGVKLHEWYFENMTGGCNRPYGEILRLIVRDYVSYDEWVKRFINVGLSMRGWVVLSIDPIDERLHIYGSDAHDVGPIWNAFPLLVLDVYEHSYMIDFGINRKKYINAFFMNINWCIVNNRLNEYYLKHNMLPPEIPQYPITYPSFF